MAKSRKNPGQKRGTPKRRIPSKLHHPKRITAHKVISNYLMDKRDADTIKTKIGEAASGFLKEWKNKRGECRKPEFGIALAKATHALRIDLMQRIPLNTVDNRHRFERIIDLFLHEIGNRFGLTPKEALTIFQEYSHHPSVSQDLHLMEIPRVHKVNLHRYFNNEKMNLIVGLGRKASALMQNRTPENSSKAFNVLLQISRRLFFPDELALVEKITANDATFLNEIIVFNHHFGLVWGQAVAQFRGVLDSIDKRCEFVLKILAEKGIGITGAPKSANELNAAVTYAKAIRNRIPEFKKELDRLRKLGQD